jgi:predicted membrane-bound dolichyl-phosphate-mannose-protein mannosyltransferase
VLLSKNFNFQQNLKIVKILKIYSKNFVKNLKNLNLLAGTKKSTQKQPKNTKKHPKCKVEHPTLLKFIDLQ